MKHWKLIAETLAPQEDELRKTMSKHVRRLMKGKRVLLMTELAESIGWPDMSLFDEMVEGFKLVGMVPNTNIFRPGITLPTMSEEELNRNSIILRPMILGKLRTYEDEKLQKEILAITLEESADKGWLHGPLSPEAVSRVCGRDCLPDRQFAIRQKDKIRPIDNFKESKLNETFGSFEK